MSRADRNVCHQQVSVLPAQASTSLYDTLLKSKASNCVTCQLASGDPAGETILLFHCPYRMQEKVVSMESPSLSAQSLHARRLRLIMSVLAISIVGLAAVVVPHVVHTAQAATPKPANTCLQPPAGTDPTTFTPVQLTLYGLPPRLPKQDQTMWATMVRHAKHRTCTPAGTRPAHAHPRSLSPTPVAPSSAHVLNSECNACWSGYEAYGTTYNFAQIWGIWQVPCVPGNASTGETGYQFSAWIGIGGDTVFDPVNATQFVQLGVDATYETIYGQPGYHPFPSATYQAWYEFFDQPHLGTTGEEDMFPVYCNDWVMAEIDVPDGIMWLGDFQNNGYFSQSFATTDTNMAECIVEQPSGPDITGLLDFGTQSFYQCFTDETTTNTVGSLDLFTNRSWTTMRQVTSPLPFGPPLTVNIPKTSVGPIDTSNTNGSFTVTWLGS